MFNKIEMLKNANKYYLNMYGEVGEVADWCFTTGIINEMQQLLASMFWGRQGKLLYRFKRK